MLRSFNERGVVNEYTHDIFDPYKLLRSDLSGRYFIDDISKLKKVMKRDFNDFPDDLFGVLDVSIISHTVEPFIEQKKLSGVIEYLSALPIMQEIKLYNEEPGVFPKDNMNYVINERERYVYKNKNGATYRAGRTRTKEDLYKSYIIENPIDIGFNYEDHSDDSFGLKGISTTKELKDYFQGVSIMYTFYASNGTIYNAQVKLDDAIVEVTQCHFITGDLASRKSNLVRYPVKSIMGASVFAVNPDGTIFDYLDQQVEPTTADAEYYENGQGGDKPRTPKTFEEKEPYLNRKVLLQIYFKSHITSNNSLKEQLYSIEDMKKEMIVKNEVDIVDSKYNFRRNRVITRASYLVGGYIFNKNSLFYPDITRIHRGWNYRRQNLESYYYNNHPTVSYHFIDNYAEISGNAGFVFKEFTRNRGFPSEKDFLIDWYTHISEISEKRWRNQEYFISFFENNPDMNMLMPIAGNAYGFYTDLYGAEWDKNNIHRGEYFTIELKGELPENPPVMINLPLNGTVQKINTHGSLSNITIRNDDFSRTPSSPIKYTHWVYPYKENHKYTSIAYPCVNWFSFPWHRRGFERSIVIDSFSSGNYISRYKYVQCMYCAETYSWNLKDLNTGLWLQSRSPSIDGPRLIFGWAHEKEDTNPNGYFYERSSPMVWINAAAF